MRFIYRFIGISLVIGLLGCASTKTNTHSMNSATQKASTSTKPVGKFCKQADIIKAVTSMKAELQQCLNQEGASLTKSEGQVTLKWLIMLDGSVQSFKVLENDHGERLATCLIKSLQQAEFERPNGGICQVKFPFKFRNR